MKHKRFEQKEKFTFYQKKLFAEDLVVMNLFYILIAQFHSYSLPQVRHVWLFHQLNY
jgi:hypothetical protein